MAKVSMFEIVPSMKCESKGQALQVWEVLSSNNSPKSIKEIAESLEANPSFKTRQTSERIAAYYVCVFKKSGLVRTVETTTELSLNENENDVFEIE